MEQTKEAAYGCQMLGTIQINSLQFNKSMLSIHSVLGTGLGSGSVWRGLFVFGDWSYRDGFHGDGEQRSQQEHKEATSHSIIITIKAMKRLTFTEG